MSTPEFTRFIRDQLSPLGDVTTRRMFGMVGVFCEGVMFGVIADNMLYFRVDDHNRVAFKDAKSFAPLSYVKQGRSIDLAFWRAPDRVFDDQGEFVDWARAALAAAHRVAAGRGGAAVAGRLARPAPKALEDEVIKAAITARLAGLDMKSERRSITSAENRCFARTGG
jgi:DNA transformation protein and related proteins